jgi:hypothetical protein
MLIQYIKDNMLFNLKDFNILSNKQKSKIRKSIALIQVYKSLTIIFILLTSSNTMPSVK